MPVTHAQLLSPRLETALLSASAITLSFGMAYGFHLERPYWAGIAAMVLSQSAQGQSLQKGLWRMAGTVLGAAAGMALIAGFGGGRISLLAAYGIALVLSIMLMQGSSYSYFYYSTALMAVLVGAQSHGEAPFYIAAARMQENLVGIAAYTLCALCLRPSATSQELDGLSGFGQGFWQELRQTPRLLLGRLSFGAKGLAALGAVTAVWQILYPPGTGSTLFVEIAALLVLLVFMTGRVAAWEVLFAMAAGVAASLWLYVCVLPVLDGFIQLGMVIFGLSFLMAWLLPEPEQGMARMGLLMPVFVLSGMGGEVFGPQGFLSGALGLLCAALTVAVIFSFLVRTEDGSAA